MGRVRAWALTGQPVDRLRVLLLVLTFCGMGVVIPRALASPDATLAQRALGVVGPIALCCWWAIGYRRGSFPRAALPFEALAIIAAGAPLDGPLNVLGLIILGVAFRCTYGEGLAGLEPMACYVIAMLAGLALAPIYAAQAEAAYQPFQTLGLLLGLPSWLLANALRGQQEVLRRQDVLCRAGAHLVAASSHEDIEAAGLAAVYQLLQRGGAQLVAAGEDGQASGLCLPLVGHTGLQAQLLLDAKTQVAQDEREPLEALCTLIALRMEAFQQTQTEQRTAESRADRLAELNDLKDELLDSVSHELRSPLTSIRAYSELLLTYEDTAVQHEFLGIINSESERLARLVTDVLDLTHIQSGSFAWNMTRVDVPALLRDAGRLYAPLIAREGLEFDIGVNDDLPAVHGDRDRLLQVLGNLLHNALKFTIRGSVGLVAYESGHELHMAVSDTGLGVPEAEREHIFDKFHQAGRAPEGKPAGTGLGLAICRQIVEHHGGRIWMTAAPRGSVFTVALPALPPAGHFQGSPFPSEDAAELEIKHA